MALLIAANANAYMPETGQISRFQPSLLRKSASFSFTGSVNSGGTKMPLEFSWMGPSTYELVIRNVPSVFYRSAQNASVWILQRSPRGCVLRAGNQTVSCPDATFWAKLEFSGQPDMATKALQEAGIYTPQDTAWTESDSRKVKDLATARVLARVGQNGSTPVAVLEVRGSQFTQVPDIEDGGYPEIQFDPTFLVPLMTRFQWNGELIQIRASTDTEVRHGRTRFTYVYAQSVEVGSPYAVYARFTRGEPKTGKKHDLNLNPRGAAQMLTLEENLTPEGRNFLRAVTLAH